MYDKEKLLEVLNRHGYLNDQHPPSVVMTPQWCLFALQLLTVERLDEIKTKLNHDE